MQSIFDSLVQPHFNYCSVAWDSCDKTLVIRLQKLQNRAATVLTFSGYDSDTDYLIKRIIWQNLDSQRKYHKKVMVYRSINGLALKYLSKLFTNRDSDTPCSLRANCQFLSPAQKKKRSSLAIGMRCCVIANGVTANRLYTAVLKPLGTALTGSRRIQYTYSFPLFNYICRQIQRS